MKVPKVSISRTFLMPFVESAYAVARKLPAAPFTKISTYPNYFTVNSTTRWQSSDFTTSPGKDKHWASGFIVLASN